MGSIRIIFSNLFSLLTKINKFFMQMLEDQVKMFFSNSVPVPVFSKL